MSITVSIFLAIWDLFASLQKPRSCFLFQKFDDGPYYTPDY